MHPLLMIGAAAAGGYALIKAKAAPAKPEVHPEITKAAAGLARGRMARGASPEQAAKWAAGRIAKPKAGGGFWKDKSPDEAVRF